nr:MAG TPA: protein of unknown function (DUF4969) [Caudoviricetes sp.]
MKQNFLTMMKRSVMAICAVVAMGMISASLSACSSSDDELSQDETVTPVHKPVESLLVKTMKEHPAAGWEYIKNKYGGTLKIHSVAPAIGQRFDRWIISMFLESDPGLDKWQGTYTIWQVDGCVRGYKDGEQTELPKVYLDTGDNSAPVKGAWIKMEDTGRKDEMGRKEYHIQLHIDEMKEENGDYAKDINIDITSFRERNVYEY